MYWLCLIGSFLILISFCLSHRAMYQTVSTLTAILDQFSDKQQKLKIRKVHRLTFTFFNIKYIICPKETTPCMNYQIKILMFQLRCSNLLSLFTNYKNLMIRSLSNAMTNVRAFVNSYIYNYLHGLS